MKNKIKKILAGVGLGLVGVGCLTGCAMTDDQKAALDLITEKSDEIVNLLEDNLAYNNEKLSKEAAFDMLKHARIKSQYVLNESNICSLSVVMEEELVKDSLWTMDAVYDFSQDVKKMMVSMSNGEDGKDISIAYCDLENNDNSYDAEYVDGQPVLEGLSEGWYAINVNTNIDALSQAGIQTINLEDITRVTVNDAGEYTFNVMKTSIVENNSEYIQIVNFAEIVVKDYLFKSVKVQSISKVGSELLFVKDMNDEHIEDGYGSYLFSGTITSIINMTAEYKYGNDVDLSELNSRIADIDARIESGELSIN